MDLAEFLLARIAEDEEAARSACGEQWTVVHDRHTFDDGSFCEAWGINSPPALDVPGWHDPVEIGYDRDYGTPESAIGDAPTASHIARHDPARVLAECEAKRQIIGSASIFIEDAPWWVHDYILRLLAVPFADHPDYRPEWKPT